MRAIGIQAVSRGTATALMAGFLCTTAIAEDVPEGRIILEVSGDISNGNPDGKVLFDAEKLESLGLHEIVTETPWTDGPVRFEGVLGKDLLDYIGATGTVIKATAINDYSVDIPTSDFVDYDAILATRIDGKLMTVRERGPIWVIYPWSTTSEIQNEVYYSRSIWQMDTITVSGN